MQTVCWHVYTSVEQWVQSVTDCLFVRLFAANQVSFLVQNAEDLADIPDESVDVYTIAFGIRNCTHIDRVVKEAHRVLKKGGRFMCLEFSHVENPVVSK